MIEGSEAKVSDVGGRRKTLKPISTHLAMSCKDAVGSSVSFPELSSSLSLGSICLEMKLLKYVSLSHIYGVL
jgi:hypothetical protein